jgi:hypothetical protein
MADSHTCREIEGGNAIFSAGCALSGFNLNASIRITNKLSIKADANTVLISWHRSARIKRATMEAVLHSVAEAPKSFRQAHPSLRGRWEINKVVGFYQPEHALAAVKHFNGNPDVQAQTLYTVYITAPKELSDAVLLDVEEIMSQIVKTIATWGEPRKDMFTKQDMVTLHLSGSDREEIIDLKKVLEAIFTGRIATIGRGKPPKRYEIWHDFFAMPPGGVWLQHLARDMGVIIMSDRSQRRLRIYAGEDHGVYPTVERQLAKKVSVLADSEEVHTVQFDPKEFRKFLLSDKFAEIQTRLGKSNVSLDIVKKTLVLHCSHNDACDITSEFSMPGLPPPPLACLMCPQCGDITKDIEFSTCGHVICMDCFDHQLQVASSDLTSNHFPMVCWHDGCEQPIAISDLRKHVPATLIDILLQASLTYYIRSHPEIYRNCRTPDCRSVYCRNGSYEIFTCPTCFAQTCTLCHAEPHVGWTCDSYKAHLHSNEQNQKLLDDYKAIAGTKECPKCATLIEKIDGCNHVECSGCHGHLCWECVKVFASPDAAYQHMNDAHGGNGLVDEERDDESEFDSDEAEAGDGDDNEEEVADGTNLWDRLREAMARMPI